MTTHLFRDMYAAIGGTVLQLACSMWLGGRHGRIIQFGLGMILTAILIITVLLPAMVIRKDANTPLLNIIPLVRTRSLFFLQ